MIIGIISDTHGSKKSIEYAVEAVPDAEYWLHAGDYSQDADYLAKLAGVPVRAASGNCDGYDTPAKNDEYLTLEGKEIWITHGHHYCVKENLRELRYWANQYEADIIVFGHTHIPLIERYDSRYFINPGSARYGVTCARVEIADGTVTAKILMIK